MTGWNLPPGCTNRMVEEACGAETPCECCGRFPEDCICPECPWCHEQGNPKCYTVNLDRPAGPQPHIVEYTRGQLIGQTKLRIANLKEQLQDEEMALEQLEEYDRDPDC